MPILSGKKIAILVADGFEQIELTAPRQALDDAGADTAIISTQADGVRSWSANDWSSVFPVDVPLEDADEQAFDALLLPGGVLNPDRLRNDPEAVRFVRAFVDSGKPIAAICHGPQILIDAQAVSGHVMTSYPSLRCDLINAGAEWLDEPAVVDRGLVTSRSPDDIPAFNRAMIEEFAHAHGVRHVSIIGVNIP